MTKIVQTIYAYWQKVPAGVRAGVSLFVVALVSAGMAFGWHFPADWADAKIEVAAFWAFIVPVAYGIFQKTLWPPLFAWFLSLFSLAPTVEGKQLVAAWKPAA